MDEIDRRIIGELERDGRCSWSDLAVRVGLGPSATTDRVRRLEAEGVITGYHARISPHATRRPLEARIAIRLVPRVDTQAVIDMFRNEPDVVEAVHLTGDADYELTARCADTRGLDELLERMKATGRIAASTTRVVLRCVVP